MLNTIYLKLTDELIAEYKEVFEIGDEKKIFMFLRKYLNYIESDDECYNRYFTLENPLETKREHRRTLNEFNSRVSEFLDSMMKSAQGVSRRRSREAETACYLGVAHEYGLFNRKHSYTMAFYYYTISAQLNSDLGTFRLAQCYERGLGTQINCLKAVYFFRCSAKLGLTDGMHVYGTALANGFLGCEKDADLGLHFLSLASLRATKVYPYPLFDIGQWYENKTNSADVIGDKDYAFEMYYKGSRLRDPNCMHRIAKVYETGDLGKAANINKAFDFFRIAAKRGQVDAQISVSEMYFSGVGTNCRQSKDQSYCWALRAATKGSGRGAYILGEYSIKGFGVEGDMLLGLWWYSIANSLGYEGALERVIELKNEVERWDEGPFIVNGCCFLFC